jgi:hypothetical protein
MNRTNARTALISVVLVLAGTTAVGATAPDPASSTEAVAPAAPVAPTPDEVDAQPVSLQGLAALWARELHRVAAELEERAVIEAGDDSQVQLLQRRAGELRTERTRLLDVASAEPDFLGAALQRSMQRTPEVSAVEKARLTKLSRAGQVAMP